MGAAEHFGGLLPGDPERIRQFHRVEGDRLGLRLSETAQHERCGKRPGLAGEIADLAHPYPGLLEDFPPHRRFQRLARLHEAREQRVHPLGPVGGAADEQPVAPHHEHDDDGVGPRKMPRPAGRTSPLPTRLGHLRGCAAGRAEAVRHVPAEQRLRRRSEFRRAGIEARDGGAQFDEARALRHRRMLLFGGVEEGAERVGRDVRLPGRYIGCEPRAGMVPAEKHRSLCRLGQHRMARRHRCDSAISVDSGLATPEGKDPRSRGVEKLRERPGIAAKLRGPVETRTAECHVMPVFHARFFMPRPDAAPLARAGRKGNRGHGHQPRDA